MNANNVAILGFIAAVEGLINGEEVNPEHEVAMGLNPFKALWSAPRRMFFWIGLKAGWMKKGKDLTPRQHAEMILAHAKFLVNAIPKSARWAIFGTVSVGLCIAAISAVLTAREQATLEGASVHCEFPFDGADGEFIIVSFERQEFRGSDCIILYDEVASRFLEVRSEDVVIRTLDRMPIDSDWRKATREDSARKLVLKELQALYLQRVVRSPAASEVVLRRTPEAEVYDFTARS